MLVQSQRFQLTLDLIVNVLENESDYTIKRLLSSLVKFVGLEVKNSISEGNVHYKEYVKRIVEFLDIGCVGYLSNEQELDGLKRVGYHHWPLTEKCKCEKGEFKFVSSAWTKSCLIQFQTRYLWIHNYSEINYSKMTYLTYPFHHFMTSAVFFQFMLNFWLGFRFVGFYWQRFLSLFLSYYNKRKVSHRWTFIVWQKRWSCFIIFLNIKTAITITISCYQV